jgi:hypothetical protein
METRDRRWGRTRGGDKSAEGKVGGVKVERVERVEMHKEGEEIRKQNAPSPTNEIK